MSAACWRDSHGRDDRARPIAAIYRVPLGRPRRLDDMGASDFVNLVQTVRRHFHAEAAVDL
jgi:hypothetical protein